MDKKSRIILVICIVIIVLAIGITVSYAIIENKKLNNSIKVDNNVQIYDE